jgi:serine/threonine protein kinase
MTHASPPDPVPPDASPPEPPGTLPYPLRQADPGPPEGQTLPCPPAGPSPPASEAPRVPGYEILGELGRGGMGVVYKARQEGLGRVVALKMVLSGAHAGKADLERFRAEARAIAALAHPNIVQLHEIGEAPGEGGRLPYFSLEFCAGGSLADRIQGTPLPPRQAAALLETVAQAVQKAHEVGIVHRDLKPANILFADATHAGEGGPFGEPKITDFGLAKMVDTPGGTPGSGPVTRTGMVMGTPSYMAPEQAEGRTHEIGPACDIYGLGAILYECLTGRPPFVAANALDTLTQVIQQEPLPPRILNKHLDADLENIVLKCLEKEPSRRYASAGELAEDLARYRCGETVSARSVNLLEHLQRELAHSQHDTHLRPWGFGLMLLGVLIFVAHLGTSLLLVAGAPQWLSFWGPRSLLLGLLVPLFLRYRPHASIWPTNSVERLLWAVWVGYLLTFLSLFWVMQILGHGHLEIYGVVTAVSGLAWFAMGGHAWGGCYVIGATFLFLAPVMALMSGSNWAPFWFGTLWAVSLLTLGHRYWSLGRSKGLGKGGRRKEEG